VSLLRAGQAAFTGCQLAREVVYNELHDHDRHGHWRYWIEHQVQQETPATFAARR
jgi:hypothetical protein